MAVFPAQAIAQRITEVRQNIPPHVRLIAVTKQVSVEAMRAAYDAGIRDFGESRIQEAETKRAQLSDLPDVTWHLIGHLQTNKAARALELFDWIHSVDSLKLAQRLNALAQDRSVPPQVCLQVKLRSDPNKYGWDQVQLWNDLVDLDACSHLNIVGIMTIPPLGLTDDETLAVFQDAHQLAEKIRQHPWQTIRMKELSMGMSGDYPLAIQAGATLVRVGRTLFGDRS
ncbi:MULTISPECIES: YggS family pyridoxal phosphate-dependent enzyme [unclassified Leptolyngbya]|uniref:YggS family pyridoxal phosphate-dependent enzyme n=1 Tax=unclassified Leptolyngbya TaxID=2650499 RepID=UPI001684F17F|nr:MULTISPECIES: YggS family pyridoxal phosphate-dependent enzyme [unclassified Leptolyngbya]MBD1910564.1 YggS family pyridoxal phosphate-dependent enzyme [Leptolyngbya sp. FACHB-8]MBD2153935.1 YggS family pyridoxal phosphate-dependent enzyme [Leptolyngbya sp. FACHB-16]